VSVSCSLQHYDGSDRLGGLSTQTLQEIVAGSVAQHFCKTLAQGTHRLKSALIAKKLRHVSRRRPQHYVARYTLIPFGMQHFAVNCLCL
jgi:hypothetical protein